MHNRTTFAAIATAAAALLPLSAYAEVIPLRGDDLKDEERYATKVHTGGI